jgi:hypothetical protein
MKTRTLFALLLGTAATVAAINCAPVDPPPATQDNRDGEGQRRVNDAPPPVPIPGPGDPLAMPNLAPPDALKQRIDLAINQAKARQLRTDNGFWTVFHGILGLGPKVPLLDPLTGEKHEALAYIERGGRVPGLVFVPGADGLDVETGPGTFEKQGHQDQFVAEMVEWGVPADDKFVVDGQKYRFGDFLRHSKARASANPRRGQELEWALVIIGTHYGTDDQWTNMFNENVRFEDLVRAELDKDVNKAACGGTHLMFGLTWVYHLHLKHGGETTGVWKDVADRIAEHKKKARQYQNADGSFSTEYFGGRGAARDVQRRINTTGHVLEWLSLAMTDDELKEPWVQGAANALAMMFLDNQNNGLEGGSMYHAVHGLLMYTTRVYGGDKLGESKPRMVLPPSKKG